MKVVEMSVDELVPYERNARTHSEAQVDQIATSITRFGFNNPILIDSNRGIIAGHGRLLAARKLGLRKVPTVELAHLSDTDKRLYILNDNQTALLAGWDTDILRLELGELRDLGADVSLTAFSEQDLKMLEGGWQDTSMKDVAPDESPLQASVIVKCLPADAEDVHEAVSLAVRALNLTDVDIQQK